VNFRGAFGMERWDLPWTNYDPVNTEYKAQDPVSVDEEAATASAITGRAFPNPTTDASLIRYELRTADVVTITVTNATGTIHSTFFTREVQGVGVYEFNLITADLASGLYYVAITGQNGSLTIPVTVIR